MFRVCPLSTPNGQQREAFWTESVAVGGRQFVEAVQRQLRDRGRYRQIEDLDGVRVLREAPEAYGQHLEGEICRSDPHQRIGINASVSGEGRGRRT